MYLTMMFRTVLLVHVSSKQLILQLFQFIFKPVYLNCIQKPTNLFSVSFECDRAKGE